MLPIQIVKYEQELVKRKEDLKDRVRQVWIARPLEVDISLSIVGITADAQHHRLLDFLKQGRGKVHMCDRELHEQLQLHHVGGRAALEAVNHLDECENFLVSDLLLFAGVLNPEPRVLQLVLLDWHCEGTCLLESEVLDRAEVSVKVNFSLNERFAFLNRPLVLFGLISIVAEDLNLARVGSDDVIQSIWLCKAEYGKFKRLEGAASLLAEGLSD